MLYMYDSSHRTTRSHNGSLLVLSSYCFKVLSLTFSLNRRRQKIMANVEDDTVSDSGDFSNCGETNVRPNVGVGGVNTNGSQSDDTSSAGDETTADCSVKEETKPHSREQIFKKLEPGHVEERFRVDRKKLERMLQISSDFEDGETGEKFFQRIMGETETSISWPSRLKIGAKSKKDPHIKVTGTPEKVASAKSKIMSILDTKSNRVTLKMDVSYTEHSHIIGKGGNIIRKVMEETGCHIHFPDSNRCTQQQEKSNQVSIAGQITGAEQARAKIRELLPLVLFFELPITGGLQPDMNSPAVQHVVQTCNVAVNMKQKGRGFSTTVTVRGAADNPVGVKEACLKLMEHLAGTVGGSLPVSTQLEIAPQHHQFMLARGGFNIKQIMQCTGATIHFPDPSTAQRKSSVFVSGSIDAVIIARQLLMGCLPLVLMFDIKEDVESDSSALSKIMEQLDVFISFKPKPKQPGKSVIIKSVERNAASMYRARQSLLGQECESCGVHIKNGTSTLPYQALGVASLVDILGQNKIGLNRTSVIPLNRLTSLQVNPTPQGTTPTVNSQIHSRVMQHGVTPVVLQSQAMNQVMIAQAGTNVQPPSHLLQAPLPSSVPAKSQHVVSSASILPLSRSSPTFVQSYPQNGPSPTALYPHQCNVQPHFVRLSSPVTGDATRSCPSPHHIHQPHFRPTSPQVMPVQQLIGQMVSNNPSAPRSPQSIPTIPQNQMVVRPQVITVESTPTPLPQQACDDMIKSPRVMSVPPSQMVQPSSRTTSPVEETEVTTSHTPMVTKSVVFTSASPTEVPSITTTISSIAVPTSVSLPLPSTTTSHQNAAKVQQPVQRATSPPLKGSESPSSVPVTSSQTNAPRKMPAPPPGFSKPNPEMVSSQLVQLHLSGGVGSGPPQQPPSTLKGILRTSTRTVSPVKHTSSSTTSDLSQSSTLHSKLYKPSQQSFGIRSSQDLSPASSGHFSPNNSGHFSPSNSGHFSPNNSGHFSPNNSGHVSLHNSGHFMSSREKLFSPQKKRSMTPQESFVHFLGDRNTASGLSQGSSESEVDSDSSDKRAPGWERKEKQRELEKLEELVVQLDYEQKKLLAQKAMKNLPVSREVRTPTDTWSGLGFSKSMPDSHFRNITKKNGFSSRLPSTYEHSEQEMVINELGGEPQWPQRSNINDNPGSFENHRNKVEDYRLRRQDSMLSCSNYIDSTSLPRPTKGLWSHTELNSSLSVKPDLSELFVNLGLGKYTDVFQQQEIDLATFLTLTDNDLKELGISTFGARRKMLLAISDLNQNRNKTLVSGSSRYQSTTLVENYNDSVHMHNSGRSSPVMCW